MEAVDFWLRRKFGLVSLKIFRRCVGQLPESYFMEEAVSAEFAFNTSKHINIGCYAQPVFSKIARYVFRDAVHRF